MYKPVDELARALINFKPGYIFSQNYKPNELVNNTLFYVGVCA